MPADLFAQAAMRSRRGQPLAERMRPRALCELVGQDHLVGPQGWLRLLLAQRSLPSLILQGPPGSGKTSLAGLLAAAIGAQTEALSAVTAGVKELRAAMATAATARDHHGRRTVLFIDEIHRFNRAQQDALLPHIEAGTVILVGATTHNPAFELSRALLSRCRVAICKPLSGEALLQLLQGALTDPERGLGGLQLQTEPAVLKQVADISQGDARTALGILEVAGMLACQAGAPRPLQLTLAHVQQAAPHRLVLQDRDGEAHHQCISALIKSMRGSDPDAAVYYLTRLLEAGESPHFLLRRMVIFASEDIGNACPMALQVATSALHAFDLVGLPEGALALTQAATYLACADKSAAVPAAYAAAQAALQRHGTLPIPTHLHLPAQSTATPYRSPHQAPNHFSPQAHLPEPLRGQHFYAPTTQGEEAALAARLAGWRAARQAAEAHDRAK